MNDAPGHLKEEYDDVYDWFFDEDDDGKMKAYMMELKKKQTCHLEGANLRLK